MYGGLGMLASTPKREFATAQSTDLRENGHSIEGLGVLFAGVEVVGPHRADHGVASVAARQQRSQETQELLRRKSGGGGQQLFELIDGQQQRRGGVGCRGGRLDGRAPGLAQVQRGVHEVAGGAFDFVRLEPVPPLLPSGPRRVVRRIGFGDDLRQPREQHHVVVGSLAVTQRRQD